MKTVVSGSNAVFEVDLLNAAGEVINGVSLSYDLYDGNNTQISIIQTLPETAYAPGDSSFTVTIEGSNNNLTDVTVNESRLLTVSVVDVLGETTVISIPFIIVGDFKLAFMMRSYQSYQEAELTAFSIANIDNWNNASEHDKIQALIGAFDRIGQMTFAVSSNANSYNANTSALTFGFGYVAINKLNLLTLDYINTLPADFINRLKMAQVLEADTILSEKTEVRKSGLISRRIGESMDVWQGKPLSLPVSKRALQALAGYVHYGSVLSRG